MYTSATDDVPPDQIARFRDMYLVEGIEYRVFKGNCRIWEELENGTVSHFY